MNNKKKRLCFAVAVVIWMGVIFFFSAQNGQQSSQISNGITMRILRLLYPNLDNLSNVKQMELLDTFSFFVRKAAHFTEYAILGFLISGFFQTFYWKKWSLILNTWLLGTAYAFSDEFHQMFLEGRSPKVGDVWIDSSGVLSGILAFYVVCAIITSIRHRSRAKKLQVERKENDSR